MGRKHESNSDFDCLCVTAGTNADSSHWRRRGGSSGAGTGSVGGTGGCRFRRGRTRLADGRCHRPARPTRGVAHPSNNKTGCNVTGRSGGSGGSGGVASSVSAPAGVVIVVVGTKGGWCQWRRVVGRGRGGDICGNHRWWGLRGVGEGGIRRGGGVGGASTAAA